MRNKIFFEVSVIMLMFCVNVRKVHAQIEDIYFPYPNYMHWYDAQTVESLDYKATDAFIIDYAGWTFGLEAQTIYRYAHPYNFHSPSRVDSCKIYGLAGLLSVDFPIIRACYANEKMLYPYYNGFPYDMPIEAFVFEATEGDSLVRLVKKQVFMLEKGQYPDKGMHYSDTGGVRAPVYEFYFDTPVTVKGTFFVALYGPNPDRHGDYISTIGYGPILAYRYGNFDHCLRDDTVGKFLPGYVASIGDERIVGEVDAYIKKNDGKYHQKHTRSQYGVLVPDMREPDLFYYFHPPIFPIISLHNDAVDEPGEAGDGVEVSPNPSRGRATVRSMRAIRSVEVCDMSGRVVIRKRMGGGQHSVELTERLPQGCYVVRVETEQGSAVKKLVVE